MDGFRPAGSLHTETRDALHSSVEAIVQNPRRFSSVSLKGEYGESHTTVGRPFFLQDFQGLRSGGAWCIPLGSKSRQRASS